MGNRLDTNPGPEPPPLSEKQAPLSEEQVKHHDEEAREHISKIMFLMRTKTPKRVMNELLEKIEKL